MPMIPLVKMVCTFLSDFVEDNKFEVFIVSDDSVILSNEKCFLWIRRSWGDATFSIVEMPINIQSNLYYNITGNLLRRGGNISFNKEKKFPDERDYNTYYYIMLASKLLTQVGQDILDGNNEWKIGEGSYLLREQEINRITNAFAAGAVSCRDVARI